MSYDTYQSPLGRRYASKEMLHLFSEQHRHSLWRKLWIALAKAEKSLGLPITNEQIEEMEAHSTDINFERVAELERITKHDVMAHLHAYAEQCPKAKPIIHLGATSAYVTDNTDLIQMKEGLRIVCEKLIQVIHHLGSFASKYKATPCLSYTHFQPAQPTTVGKRACLWLQEFLLDLNDLQYRMDSFSFLGVKGATGTQASFQTLFEGDHEKIGHLESIVAQEWGFDRVFPISGQTYTRKQDAQIINVLAGIATTAHKFATDLRLLAHLNEIEEPFAEDQVGSSAMPYKRNPIKSERICSLARYLLSLAQNPSYTAATQWLERSLDDSANRRLCIPEAFLVADALLMLLLNIIPALEVNEQVIQKHLNTELPFLVVEDILMEAVRKGGDRQTLHERLKGLCLSVSQSIKIEGKENDLVELILKDPSFRLSTDDIARLFDVSRLIGRSIPQVDDFLRLQVHPAIEKYGKFNQDSIEIML